MSGWEKQNTVTKRKKRQRQNLKNKELRRQLMGIGVQRNDADAFIRAYRAIEKAGAQRICQEIMVPPIRGETQYGRAEKLVAEVAITDQSAMYMTPENLERNIRRSLAQKLARELMESGAVKLWQRRMQTRKPGLESTVTRAEVWVVTEVEE